MLWLVLSLVGLVLLGVEAWQDPAAWSAKWPYVLPATIVLLLLSQATWGDLAALALGAVGAGVAIRTGVVAPELITAAWAPLAVTTLLASFLYAMWYFGLIAGGADAKALLALCVLVPFPIALAEGIPLLPSALPGSFSILADSLLAFLVIPLGLLAWNLAHGDLRLPHALLGVKRRAADVQRGHQWPMETVDEQGARRTRLFASRMSDEEIAQTFERVQALGDERVWVSPKIPFMIPMLAGLLLAFFVGDLMLALVSRFA